MASLEYTPLVVTAHLRSGVIADQYLPLDGVLLAQATRRDLGAQPLTIPGASRLAQPKGEPLLGGPLPIKRVHGVEWYYRCSWAQWGPYTDGQDFWNKRFDVPLAYLVDFQGRRGVINNSAAEYKAYHMPVWYRSALWVRWYVMGNLQGISALLACVTHLGKKAAQGWGRVAGWEIAPAAEDWSLLRDGRLMRGLPPADAARLGLSGCSLGIYGVRPSYWDKRNQITLAMPPLP